MVWDWPVKTLKVWVYVKTGSLGIPMDWAQEVKQLGLGIAIKKSEGLGLANQKPERLDKSQNQKVGYDRSKP